MTALSVEDALDDYVASLEEERHPDGYWHPSSLFGCARRAVYEFTGAEKPPLDKRTKRIFRLGHIFHEFLQTALARSPQVETFYAEVKVVDPDRMVKGHADGLALMDDGTWVVLEAKSIGTYGFKSLAEEKDDHAKQVKTYVRILRKYGGSYKVPAGDEHLYAPEDLHWPTDPADELAPYLVIPPLGDLVNIAFAYMSKDDLSVKEYQAVFTDADETWLDEYLDRLSLHAFEGTLPRRLVNTTPTGRVSKTRAWECGYCPFATQCWSPREPEGIA